MFRMKLARPFIVTSVACLAGAAIFFAVRQAVPRWIEHQIESVLAENSVRGQAKVSDLSLQGLSLRVSIQSPVSTTLPLIRVQRLNGLEFRVFSLEKGSPLSMPQGAGQVSLLFNGLNVRGAVHLRPFRVQLAAAQAEIGILQPLQARVRIAMNGDLSAPQGQLDIELPAQTIKSAEIFSPLRLCWKVQSDPQFSNITADSCEQKSSFEVRFPKIPRFRVHWINRALRYSTKLSSISGELQFANEGSRGKFSYQFTRSPHEVRMVGKSEAHLGITSLRRTLKRLNIQNTDLKNSDLHLEFDARLPTSKSAAAAIRSSFEAQIPEGSIRGLDLRGFHLKTEMICSGSWSELKKPLQSCKFDSVSSPLLIEAERIGKLQPMRDVQFVLNDQTQGRFTAQWQGAQLSTVLSELNIKSLASSSGVVKLQIKSLSLFELLKLLSRPDLSGRGVLEGSGAIRWNSDQGLSAGLWIDQASLNALGPGEIRYGATRDQKAVDTLKEFQSLLRQGQQALVLKALENFHYRELGASITRNPKELLRIELKLSGKNPSLAKGQPFEFHMPVEGNVEGLIIDSLIRDFSNLPLEE